MATSTIPNYSGKPLRASCLDSDGWSGNSNFQASNQSHPTSSIKTVEDAFEMLRMWQQEPAYQYGYVLDRETMVLYYDNEKVLEYFKKPQTAFWIEGCKFQKKTSW